MSDFAPMIIARGNLATVLGTLVDAGGGAVDLTGCAVAFTWQKKDDLGVTGTGAATVVSALLGKVSYLFTSGQTDVAGEYVAQWTTTKLGVVALYPFPGGFDGFTIAEVLPIAAGAGMTLIRDLYEPVRAILGDFNPQFRKYEDAAIAGVVRTCLNLGRVPGQRVSTNRLGIVPGIVTASDLGLLTYHTAKMFVLPNAADYGYKTRAISENFGRQEHFVRDLENAIYELEAGEMFSSFQSFYSWVNALTGVNIWAVMTDMKTTAPVCTVSVGRAGIVVSTT